MVITGRMLIMKAMQKAGILTKNEVPTSAEVNDALECLNALMASWLTDSLLSSAAVQESLPLTLDDIIDLPPGWELALIWNLAEDLLPEYGMADDPRVERKARLTKGHIKRAAAAQLSLDSIYANNKGKMS